MSTKQQAKKEWRRQRCNFIEEFTLVGLCISGHRPAEIKFHLAVGWFNPLFLMSQVRTLPNSRIGLRKRQLKFGVCQRHLFGIHRRERQLVVDSGVSMRMMSEKDLNSAELETVRISKVPTTVVTKPMARCNRRRGNSVCQGIGFFRDSNVSRRYTGNSFTRKTLRRSQVSLPLDKR